ASLDASGRAAAAENSLRIRPARIRVLRRDPTMGGALGVGDDIVTTGATLAAVTVRLEEANLQVTGAAVLAATQRRKAIRQGLADLPPGGSARACRHPFSSPNEG